MYVRMVQLHTSGRYNIRRNVTKSERYKKGMVHDFSLWRNAKCSVQWCVLQIEHWCPDPLLSEKETTVNVWNVEFSSWTTKDFLARPATPSWSSPTSYPWWGQAGESQHKMLFYASVIFSKMACKSTLNICSLAQMYGCYVYVSDDDKIPSSHNLKKMCRFFLS